MYYTSDGTRFKLWIDARIHQNRTGHVPLFDYHNNVWKSLRQDLIPDRPLWDLYKEQAQRLRDQHSWLSLMYSGGADSHNILMAFLLNGVHLDEVITCDSSFGRPATFDTNSLNLHSEFELTAAPVLNWVIKTYPKTKVTVIKSTPDSIAVSGESLHNQLTNHRLLTLFNGFEHDTQITSIGTLIVGQDKPFLIKNGENFFFSFSCIVSNFSNRKSVPFYWDHTFPELHINQCRVLARNGVYIETGAVKESQLANRERYKDILYKKTWHRKFQVNKMSDYFEGNPYTGAFNYIDPLLWKKMADLRQDILTSSHLTLKDIYPCRTEQFPLYLPPFPS
jgi:hypothetical protein